MCCDVQTSIDCDAASGRTKPSSTRRDHHSLRCAGGQDSRTEASDSSSAASSAGLQPRSPSRRRRPRRACTGQRTGGAGRRSEEPDHPTVGDGQRHPAGHGTGSLLSPPVSRRGAIEGRPNSLRWDEALRRRPDHGEDGFIRHLGRETSSPVISATPANTWRHSIRRTSPIPPTET